MKLKNRHFLRSNDIKKLKSELSSSYNIVQLDKLFSKNTKVEIAELEDLLTIYFINGQPFLFRQNNILFPSLKSIINNLLTLPEISVDIGAVKFVTNGADIMRPGITFINPIIKKNSFVKIVDEKFKHPLAIGLSLYDADYMISMNKGKVVKNIHYLNDKIWKFLEKSSDL
ncbi:MAG: RNA-binding protein [Candidatus Helarchaeota archaeon]